MRLRSLEIVRCPGCRGRIEAVGADLETSSLSDGLLECTECKRRYAVGRGMAFLHLEYEASSSKAREAQGWVDYHKMKGIYDQTGVETDFALPYFPEEPWVELAKQFDIGLEIANLKGGERVLDLGAGRGWAAKHFALMGCDAVAVDIVPDEQVGLGRARALMQRAGVYYETIIGDSENLPLADDVFDLVFCCGVLHHSTSLEILAASIRRILKPGGRLLAIHEPCVPEWQNEAEALFAASEELACGINERRYDLAEHYRAFQQAGFSEIEVFPWQSYHLSDDDLRSWSMELGITGNGRSPDSLFWLLRHPRQLMNGIPGHHRGFRGLCWLLCHPKLLLRRLVGKQGGSVSSALPKPRSDRERLQQRILRQCGGSIVLCARK
ncbi:MAG: methyltransferase domain-containing protein [Chloroflexi bacterium]|nr:methyltransferase domain-containing protein [Chloroflexota bacterium]